MEEHNILPKIGVLYEYEDNGENYLTVDVVENLVPRQKEEYSSKKKTHTMKYLAISDHKGKLLFLSHPHFGSTHDKLIFDTLNLQIDAINLLTVVGFQGIQNDMESVILPYKKSKNA